MYKINSKSICEYIWIGGQGEIRSKVKIIDHTDLGIAFLTFPEWNFDASSTGQLSSDDNTEGILKPVNFYKNPLQKTPNCNNFLVLCEAYDINGNPLKKNFRSEAVKIFNQNQDEQPWFGLEQEYLLVETADYNNIHNTKDTFFDHYCGKYNTKNTFDHYCGKSQDFKQRQIAIKHMEACLETGLKISGINSEVALNQWEFQIGPCEGIFAADQLIIARFLLERIAEQYNFTICYEPKPNILANGSGCHTNFSTKTTRDENGLDEIMKMINKLEKNHLNHMEYYGENNRMRLTGKYETADYNKFSWGIGTRNTSIRIPNAVNISKCGYIEDRRPAANIDPYLVTSLVFKTCCLEN